MVNITVLYHALIDITDLSVDLVRNGNLDRFESVQDIELQMLAYFQVCRRCKAYLGQVNRIVEVNRVTVAHDDQVCVFSLVTFSFPSISSAFEVAHTKPKNN